MHLKKRRSRIHNIKCTRNGNVEADEQGYDRGFSKTKNVNQMEERSIKRCIGRTQSLNH